MTKHGPSAPYFIPVNDAHKEWFEFFMQNRNRMGNTLLNIGLSKTEVKAGEGWVDWFIKELDQPFEKLYILELYLPYVKYFTELYKNNNKVKIIYGDVREATKYIKFNIDTTFWFHGPEHIPINDLHKAFEETNKITNKAIFWMCPWGKYYGLHCGINEPDNHHFFPEDEHFNQFGFDIIHSGGAKNTGSANINAYVFK